jgi:hypothetical protein
MRMQAVSCRPILAIALIAATLQACNSERPDPSSSIEYVRQSMARVSEQSLKSVPETSARAKNWQYWKALSQAASACNGVLDALARDSTILPTYVTSNVISIYSDLDTTDINPSTLAAVRLFIALPSEIAERESASLFQGGIDAGNVGFSQGGAAGVGNAIGSGVGTAATNALLAMVQFNYMNSSFESARSTLIKTFGDAYPQISFSPTSCISPSTLARFPAHRLYREDLNRK